MNIKNCAILLLLSVVGLISCATPKDISYFQGLDQMSKDSIGNSKYTVSIEPDDNLLITVSAPHPLSAVPYNNITNLAISGSSTTATIPSTISASSTPSAFQGYLVDSAGYINFPNIGAVKLGGLTKKEAVDLLTKRIAKYIEDPVVNLRFLNYKIKVMGEVARPGVYTFTDEKISVLDALSAAGEMTIYGKRTNVLIYRDVNGKKEFARLDMHSANMLNSDFFYLHQNDVVYVEPNSWKSSTARTYNPNLPIILSAISTLVTVVALIVTIRRN